MWPMSLAPCSKQHSAQVVCRFIDSADPGNHLASLEVLGVWVSLDYLCQHSEDQMMHAEQWSYYLSHHWQDVPCVALGSLHPYPSS